MTLTLEESICATVSYYDLFAYPLTEREVWVNLFANTSASATYAEFLAVLGGLMHGGRLQCTDGLVHLCGRTEIVGIRKERYGIAERKFSRALWFARFLMRLPFVRMVALCNTLALSNASDESDIDFFIIVKDGWIWFVRGLATGLAALLRVRPYQRGSARDTMCLSFFASDASLSLERLALPVENGIPDVYLCSWVRHLVPVYDDGGYADSFRKAQGWAETYYAHSRPFSTHARRTIRSSRTFSLFKNFIESAFSLLHAPLEGCARALQMTLLPEELRAMANSDTRVVLSGAILKFHPNDRREEIRKKFSAYLPAYTANRI